MIDFDMAKEPERFRGEHKLAAFLKDHHAKGFQCVTLDCIIVSLGPVTSRHKLASTLFGLGYHRRYSNGIAYFLPDGDVTRKECWL